MSRIKQGGATTPDEIKRENEEKRKKKKAEREAKITHLHGKNGDGSALLSLPKDRSYLSKINIKGLIKVAKAEDKIRKLTATEALTRHLGEKNNYIKQLEVTIATLRREAVGLHDQIAKVMTENVQIRRGILDRETQEQMAKLGMVYGMPCATDEDGVLHFVTVAPEGLPAWLEEQDKKKKEEPKEPTEDNHSHEHGHNHDNE